MGEIIRKPNSIEIENQTLELLIGYNTNAIVCYKDDLHLYQQKPEFTENHFIKFEATVPAQNL